MATLLRKVCPNCNHTLLRGPLSFGPAAVQCKKCGNSVNTGLRSWLDLSGGRKVWVILAEMFAPSVFAYGEGPLRFLVNMFFYSLSFLPVLGILAPSATNHANSEIFVTLALTLSMFWYPALLAWRILRLRDQSIHCKQDGQVYKW